jgi:hypothetical protein
MFAKTVLSSPFFLLLLLLICARPTMALVLPPDAIELTQIHVQFEWPPVGGATSYDLWVVEDNGAPDPFAGAPAEVDQSTAGAEVRMPVTVGLAFGKSYAWRVRGDDGAAMAWGPTYRFQIEAIPISLPTITATSFAGSIQPGITLFGLYRQGAPDSVMLAVDEVGQLVWFLELETKVLDLELLDNGRILFNATEVAYEATLNGQVAWRSPPGDELPIHHEVSLMPNGDVLLLAHYEQEVDKGGDIRNWRGDRIIVLDRDTNAIVWDWGTFDYFSTLDYDQTEYDLNEDPFDWTHSNALIYDPATDSIYLSVRHLSRITQIDYSTGDIIYNMGFAMPSGDTTFGDNLFSFQHAPELQPNGNILIFDNGNRRDHTAQTAATGISKAVEVALSGGSPPTGASIAWEWTMPDYNRAFGDADRLANGNTLVTSGGAATLHEVAADGSEVWRLEIISGNNYNLYRAERVDSILIDAPGDTDLDGLTDFVDNCPDHPNPMQEDCNGDGFGDVCSLALQLSPCFNAAEIQLVPAAPPIAQLLLALSLVLCGSLVLRGGPTKTRGGRLR